MIENIIQTTLNSFDFAYCIVVNILTYIIIKCIDKPLTTWNKRLILLGVILITGACYILFKTDLKLLFNSAILAPVFWSWIMKPVCKYFDIDYKKINIK